jgi:anti-anti-sigma factor
MFISEEEITAYDDIKLVLLNLHGTLELSTVLEFRGRLNNLLSRGQNHIIINLSQLSFIDSSGLTALVTGARSFREQGGVLLISNVSPSIAYTFEITMMEEILSIYSSQEEALQSFHPGQNAE